MHHHACYSVVAVGSWSLAPRTPELSPRGGLGMLTLRLLPESYGGGSSVTPSPPPTPSYCLGHQLASPRGPGTEGQILAVGVADTGQARAASTTYVWG